MATGNLAKTRGMTRYLGDGVYAEHDGHQVWLYTGEGPGESRIALEPHVWQRLVQYVAEIDSVTKRVG